MNTPASLLKLQKIFALEAQRGFDNGAVMGGLPRMLAVWEDEARAEGLPEELIRAVATLLRDYDRLGAKSRAEVLRGLWQRIHRTIPDTPSWEALTGAVEAPQPARAG